MDSSEIKVPEYFTEKQEADFRFILETVTDYYFDCYGVEGECTDDMANGFYAGFVVYFSDCDKLDTGVLRLKSNKAKALRAYNTRFFQYAEEVPIDFYSGFVRAYEYMIEKYGMDSDGY